MKKKIAQNKPAQKWSYRRAAATRPERCRRLGREKEVLCRMIYWGNRPTHNKTQEIQDHRKCEWEKHEKRRPMWEIINTLRMNTATAIYINFNIHVQPRSLPSKHQYRKKSWWSWKLVEIGQQGANNATQFSVMPIDQIVRRSSDWLSISTSDVHFQILQASTRADSIEFSALVFVVARARGWLVKNHAWHVEKFFENIIRISYPFPIMASPSP